MLAALPTVLPVFLIVLMGYFASKLGIVTASNAPVISRLVVFILLPMLMFQVVATTDWHHTWNGDFAIISLIGGVGMFALGLSFALMRGVSLGDSAIEATATSYANAAFIGLPLLTLVIGPQAAPFIVVAACLTLSMLMALGTIVSELSNRQSPHIGLLIWHTLFNALKNPVVLSPLCGFLWWLTGWPLSDTANRVLHLLGAAAAPVALVSIGMFLAQRPIKHAIASPVIMTLSAIKLFVHPALTAWLAYRVFALPSETAMLAVLLAALPTGTGPVILSNLYHRDSHAASGVILMTTLLSLFTMSGLIAFFGR